MLYGIITYQTIDMYSVIIAAYDNTTNTQVV